MGTVLGTNLFAYCANNQIININFNAYATIKITFKKEFLRDVVTASTSALGTIIGAALGWIIGGSLSRKFINKDITFKFGCLK